MVRKLLQGIEIRNLVFRNKCINLKMVRFTRHYNNMVLLPALGKAFSWARKKKKKRNAKFEAEIGRNAKNLMGEVSETNNKNSNRKSKKKMHEFSDTERQRGAEEKYIHTK